MLSNTSKYAIRAVIYIAFYGTREHNIDIRTISNKLDIPSPFLAKILQVLARHEILSSTKGPNGGFGMKKDPFSVSLYDIVKIFDGDDLFKKCLISLRVCNADGIQCPMHAKYEEIRKQLIEMFKHQSIGKLANEMKRTGREIMI
jgi:Rrf2 family iron-sulfur cluster assembly transcriptional regulator